MRSYILTEDERRRLRAWIETDLEDQTTRNLFADVRACLPRLRDDVLLLIETRRKLRLRGRWARRPRRASGSRSRRGGSG